MFLQCLTLLKVHNSKKMKILGDIKMCGRSKMCSDALENLEKGGERCSDLPE